MPHSRPMAATASAVLLLPLLSRCAPMPANPAPAAPSPSSVPSAAPEAAHPAEPPPDSALLERARQSFSPISVSAVDAPDQVALGRALFFETRLSADGKVGCVSCHLPEHFGTDGRAKARGAFGREGPRNAPSVFNAGGQLAEHWRGDRTSLADQAEKSLLGPSSFALKSNQAAVEQLRKLGYERAFDKAFPDDEHPVTVENFGKAIAAYEATLVTPAPIDDYLAGNLAALSKAAKTGLEAFLDIGCSRCHRGPRFGGASLEKFGVVRDYRPLTHSTTDEAGRFDVTKSEADRDVFKVPVLRNVAQTAPYFHDGSVATLPEAVRIMAAVQLDRDLDDSQVANLIAFLNSLTGTVPTTFSPPSKP